MQISGSVDEGRHRAAFTDLIEDILPLSDEKVQKMSVDPMYDPMWADAEIPAELLSHDEIMAPTATVGEQDLLALPDGSAVTHVFESISERNGHLLMVQEVVLSPRQCLIFDFPFPNRP